MAMYLMEKAVVHTVLGYILLHTWASAFPFFCSMIVISMSVMEWTSPITRQPKRRHGTATIIFLVFERCW